MLWPRHIFNNLVASLQTAEAFTSKKYSVVRLWLVARLTHALPLLLINPVARFKLIAALVSANSSVLRQAARLLQNLRHSFLGQDHSPRARKDCNAISAKSPGLTHEKSHTLPPLLLRTLSNWERNGRRPAGEEKWRLYKTAGKTWPGSSSSTPSLHGGKYLHNLRIQLGKL